MGKASTVDLVHPEECPPEASIQPSSLRSDPPVVKCITQEEAKQQQQQTLCELVGRPELLTPEQTEKLHQFLGEHHEAFCLNPEERGETDLVTMGINTGDAPPR